MVLVNIIVNGPDELRIRSLLRNEFFQLGLEGMLKVKHKTRIFVSELIILTGINESQKR